jgi:fructose-bisphosphate aldolase/2-amino-3,7-dideoxy-D-threo-hept-6-ulosonate synthase
MDHGASIGPVAGIVDMQEITDKLAEGGVDAIVVHRGIARHIDTRNAGLIVHLSAITSLSPDPNNKVQVCSVEDAIRIGADAVSIHANVGAEHEDKMLEVLGKVADDCDKFGLPLLAMMYPRGPKIKDQHGADVVAQAARVGAELGADIIKTNYTGRVETFREVVRGCGVPVIVAGGPKAETVQEILQMVHESVEAGGAGVSIGRNVFQHKNPAKMVEAISAIVHKGISVKEASEILGE